MGWGELPNHTQVHTHEGTHGHNTQLFVFGKTCSRPSPDELLIQEIDDWRRRLHDNTERTKAAYERRLTGMSAAVHELRDENDALRQVRVAVLTGVLHAADPTPGVSFCLITGVTPTTLCRLIFF